MRQPMVLKGMVAVHSRGVWFIVDVSTDARLVLARSLFAGTAASVLLLAASCLGSEAEPGCKRQSREKRRLVFASLPVPMRCLLCVNCARIGCAFGGQ
jgi:hypothetical protein